MRNPGIFRRYSLGLIMQRILVVKDNLKYGSLLRVGPEVKDGKVGTHNKQSCCAFYFAVLFFWKKYAVNDT